MEDVGCGREQGGDLGDDDWGTRGEETDNTAFRSGVLRDIYIMQKFFLLFAVACLLLQIVCPYICRLWHPPEEEDTAEALLLGEAINL